jgi:AraC family transcriptional regulator
MKLAGAGRILLWNGGSVWIGRTGDEPTGFHSHHAVQISLALSGDGLRLRRADTEWATYRAAIVAANAEHAFDGGGIFIANVFVEPESRDGQVLQQQCAGHGIHAIADAALTGEAAALFAAYRDGLDDPALIAAARAVIATLAATLAAPQGTLDPRIKRALELIRARIGDETIALADIADATHLSPDRFRHLFLEQTGIRFRPYVLWLRIEVALAAYAAHSKLTAAAQAGGFADSAHFSRTFKSMFGIAPSALQID